MISNIKMFSTPDHITQHDYHAQLCAPHSNNRRLEKKVRYGIVTVKACSLDENQHIAKSLLAPHDAYIRRLSSSAGRFIDIGEVRKALSSETESGKLA